MHNPEVNEGQCGSTEFAIKPLSHSTVVINRVGDCKILTKEAIVGFPVYEFGQRNSEMVRLIGSLLGRGYPVELTLSVVANWWNYYYAAGCIRTSPEFAKDQISACIQSTLGNSDFVKAVGIDHKKAYEEIKLEEWQSTIIKYSIIYKELISNTPTLHTPSKNITVMKRHKFCRTAKERAFVEALIVHFTYKLKFLKELPLKGTMKQLQEIIQTRTGFVLKDPELERLKTRYFTRPNKPANRLELVVVTVAGKPGKASEFELTGLRQFLPPDSAVGETFAIKNIK